MHKRKTSFQARQGQEKMFFLILGSWRAPFYNQARICKTPAKTEQNQGVAFFQLSVFDGFIKGEND